VRQLQFLSRGMGDAVPGRCSPLALMLFRWAAGDQSPSDASDLGLRGALFWQAQAGLDAALERLPPNAIDESATSLGCSWFGGSGRIPICLC